MEQVTNASYFFIPFSYGCSFHKFYQSLTHSESWEIVHDEIKYMLRHVADKLDSTKEDSCLCFHFALKDEARKKLQMISSEDVCQMEGKFSGEKEIFPFRLTGVQLYCFSTQIGVMAFRLAFDRDDSIWLATAQYYAKKVSRTLITSRFGPMVQEQEDTDTLMGLGDFLLNATLPGTGWQPFFYAVPGTERANVLTYVEVPPRNGPLKDTYRRELFHLRRCQSDGFLYEENPAQEEKEIIFTSANMVWGISPEAAVCLSCPEMGGREFIEKVFIENFHSQYLYMYVLLLHQKFMLYQLMNQIGSAGEKEKLKTYRKQLYEFEMNFSFSRITEVVQYQELYDKMSQVFALQMMYNDIREPMDALSEIEKNQREEQQKEADEKTSQGLMLLSLLAVFSALIDSFSFAESFFSWFLPEGAIPWVQAAVIILVISIFIRGLLTIFRKPRRSQNSAHHGGTK